MIGLFLPIAAVVYLADQFYLISRIPTAVSVFKKSPIRNRIIPFVYRGNYYAEIWMPSLLLVFLVVIVAMITQAITVAVWFLVVLVGLEALLFGYLLLTPLILTMREQKEYRFVKKNLKKQDIVEFIKIVDGFTNKRYRLGVISANLEKQGLVASPDNIQRLRILIAFVQSSLASEYSAQNFNQLVNIDKELAHALGYVNEHTYKIANHWDEDQLDLLCKYLEQLQQLSGKSA